MLGKRKALLMGMMSLLVATGMASIVVADDAPAAPLFSTDTELELTLELPLRTLLRQRTRRPPLEGVVQFTGSNGTPVRLDIGITTRGHQRLQICAFPPLRLDFKRSEVAGTPFEGLSRLKLVTLCRDTASYEQYLELERLVYRLYEQLGLPAFRVRAARVRYVDNEHPEDIRVAPAFFVEPLDDVAERAAMSAVELPDVSRRDIEPHALATLTLFQYVIGNTDWSATMAEPGEEACCHNTVPLALRAGDGSLVPVPYDFDTAGIVGAPYATPNAALGIRSVRERLYRGFCDGNAYVEETVAALNAARPALEAVLESGRLTPQVRTQALDYLAESYAILNNPQERQRRIVGRCRGE
jgi:hypothetical protein